MILAEILILAVFDISVLFSDLVAQCLVDKKKIIKIKKTSVVKIVGHENVKRPITLSYKPLILTLSRVDILRHGL